MARSMKNIQAEAQIDNTVTQSVDWGKAQRKAVRSFLKRANRDGIVITITKGDETITMGVRELNSLYRTLGVMSAQQRDYIGGIITLEELTPKLDTSYGYWSSDADDCSDAE